ncbi:ADP-ribosylglycohydrolase family protein [Nonomuraea harbinensis]|uniref:ADP-ribosylglycohydrolase family protein n=1 Tax=Nonomuraea harbinensis TaxID=1286938 RepID=A0ABW1BZX5_9ACTN|nr:ADP-ribosylglycohydrolase family protein [Nonomuraea harbinensis]
MTYRDRARGCLLGLAAGDALGAPAENLTPEEIRHRWGRLTEIEGGGTDDTEYAIFAAGLLAEHGHGLTSALVAAAYRERVIPAVTGPMRGAGFSELGTVQALRRGLEPPLTGLVHQHGWSDGLAMRAAPYGVFCPGDPAEAARLVTEDGRVSQSGEGILGGRAVAAAVAAAMAGADPSDAVEAALSAVPADSWTARNIVRARAALGAADPAVALHEAVVVRHYPWTDLAPEAVALALAAYLHGEGDVERSVTFGVSLGRDADTIGAIAGAVAGASQGERGVPERWAARIGPVTGRCLPVVAGRDIRDVADDLATAHATASTRATRPGRAGENPAGSGPPGGTTTESAGTPGSAALPRPAGSAGAAGRPPAGPGGSADAAGGGTAGPDAGDERMEGL